MRRLVVLLAAAGLSLAGHASPIVYSDSTVASGTLGGVAFSNLLVTAYYRGDTTGVVCSGGVCTNATGVGYLTFGNSVNILFTDSVYFFANSNSNPTAVGIYDLTQGSVIDSFSSALTGYTGQTYIGPIVGTAYSDIGHSFGTTAGALIFSSIASTSTFTAAPPAVTPEPSSLVLFGTGILGLAGVARRRMASR